MSHTALWADPLMDENNNDMVLNQVILGTLHQAGEILHLKQIYIQWQSVALLDHL